ncbi:fractalkine [Emydura macquarii macquarii]|uniref:fractalkine n=1 Tax=Emydura macquarii macquarii TaxID=1129001 RepID=UPI00352B4E99
MIASFLLLVLGTTWNMENQVAGQPRAHVQCTKSCTTFSKKIPQKLLKSYRRTEPSCPKAAVIFVTQKSKEYCADPKAGWVTDAIQQLDQISRDPLNPPLSSIVPSVTEEERAGVFHRLLGGAVSTSGQASVSANPIHGAGTTVSQAIHISVGRTEEANKSTLTLQEAMWSSTKSSSALQDTVTPSTIPSEPLANGSEVFIRLMTTPTAEVPGSISSRFSSDPTAVVKRSESFIESTNKSTEPTISPTTDIPATVPSRFNSDPTPFIKGFESPEQATYKSVGSTRNQTADVLGSASSTFTSEAPSIVNGTEIVKLSSTTPALLESVSSRPVMGLPSMGQVTENSTMQPTAVLKGSDATKGSTPHSTSTGRENRTVNTKSGDEREAVSDSTAHTTNFLSPLGKKDPPHSFSDSISPPETSGPSTKSFRAEVASESPDVPLEPAPRILSISRTHILSLVLLASVLCICSAAVGIHVKSKVCPGGSAKEVTRGLLFNQQCYQTDEYSLEAI